MNYGEISGGSPVCTTAGAGMTVDKMCKLLRAGQPIVWAFAIVFGLLCVTLTIRYLWKRNSEEKQQDTSAVDGWMRTRG